MLFATTENCSPCPLMCAVKRSQHYAVKYFLARCYPLKFKDMNWRTVLHVAVACADIQTVDLILEVKRIELEVLDCIMDKEAESFICFFLLLFFFCFVFFFTDSRSRPNQFI